MPRFCNLQEHEVIFKEPGEFVTEADFAAEKLITEKLLELYPRAIVTGEEDVAKKSLSLHELLNAECGFLIDPIDGTNNFIKGNERFAIMVVALQFGEAVASWIYIPAQDKLAVAQKGQGAFINGKRITLQEPPSELADMIGAAHINRMPQTLKDSAKKNMKYFKANRPAFCAGYDYVSLCESEKHFSTYIRTLLWDHLPGTLLYSEAGGYVRQLDGKEYTSKNDGTGLLCAPNEQLWHKIKNTLFD